MRLLVAFHNKRGMLILHLDTNVVAPFPIGSFAPPQVRCREGPVMESTREDDFVVFVRMDRTYDGVPATFEHVVGSCATHAEARRVRRDFHRASCECVIRFMGEVGGGD
jgi:hypothetical protein